METIEDSNLAIGAIAATFLEMDDLPTKDQRDAMSDALKNTLGLDHESTQEMAVLGHWFVSECGGPIPAVDRLSRKLYKLEGAAAFQPLLDILNATLTSGSGGLNNKQKDALEEIRRAFRIT